jgi:phosphate transport system protein
MVIGDEPGKGEPKRKMQLRKRFERKLSELRDQILLMGSQVEEELKTAMDAFKSLDVDLATEVYNMDQRVNQARFDIEDQCFDLIVTQQPAARDLRLVIAAMNMSIDIERMGDQAKGIAKVIPHLQKFPSQTQPPELRQMAQIVGSMLHQGMLAYAHGNIDLARKVVDQDDEVDALYEKVFTGIMSSMAKVEDADRAEATYELLRVARELERFGDLAANVAERVIYMETGSLDEAKMGH